MSAPKENSKSQPSDSLDDSLVIMNRLWDSLTEKEHDEALAAFWSCDDSDTKTTRKRLIKPLAEALRFRVVFIERAPLEKKVAFHKRVSSQKPFCYHRDDYVRSWLVENRRPLLKAFLDGCSIANDNGFATEDEPPSLEQFEAGLAAINGHFPARDIQLYVLYLAFFGGTSGFWDNLSETEGYAAVMNAAMVANHPAEEESGGEIEEEVEPESNTEGFTTLDNHLIRELVASSFQEEGALGEDAAEDLVEEVVELNASRHRSLFHRGFFHSLFERPFTFHFPGENSERRQWYLCGVLFGLLRRKDIARCVDIFAVTQKEIGEEIITSMAAPCGPKLLPLLYLHMLRAGHLKQTLRFAGNQLPRLADQSQRVAVIQGILGYASKLLREGKAAEAEPMFDLLREFIDDEDCALPPGYSAYAGPKIKRRKAQCLQAKGSFPAAKAMLSDYSTGNSDETQYQALTDLALIEGGFRSLAAILPKPKREQNIPLIDGLKRGLEHMERAIKIGGESATNAHFCLGLLATLEAPTDHAQTRADRFQTALGGMLEDAEAYSANGILEWTRFMLALALLETAEHSNLMPAADLIPPAIETEMRFPAFLWERMFEAAALFDDPGIAIQIGNYLLACRGEATECLLANAGLLARSSELFASVLEIFLARELPIRRRWDTLQRLLPEALTHEALEVAGTILDQMEVLAVKNKELRNKLIEILRDSDRYSPAWETEDAHDSLVNLLEIEGNKADAAQILRDRFFQLRGDGSSHREYSLRQVLDRIKELHGDPAQFEDLEGMLEGYCEEPNSQKIHSLRGRVLYIGGNETQEAYQARLTSELSNAHPELGVDFYFPGWSSNWSSVWPKVRTMIEKSDVVVISPMIRTHFGRRLRAYCNSERPWLPCSGRGYDSLKKSILRAAVWKTEIAGTITP